MDIEIHARVVDRRVKKIKKDWGIFFTPQWVVDFMVSLLNKRDFGKGTIRLLEPASGVCQFLFGLKRKRPDIYNIASRRVAVEVNQEMIEYISKHLCTEDIEIVHDDYLLWDPKMKFDIVIGNPPYGIPSLSEHYTIRIDNETKKKYKEIYKTWYGKYNVYGAFIEKSINLLKTNGQLLFIVPATFLILDEFKKLRCFLSENGRTEIIYMGNQIFRPDADITTVILNYTKSESQKGKLMLYEYRDNSLARIYKRDDWKGELILFSTEYTEKLNKICSFRIADIYEIRISPRTPEIKHNPYVVRSLNEINERSMFPILNGRNLKVGYIDYNSATGYWVHKEKKTLLRKFFDHPHIVVGLGFRGDSQVGAAFDDKAYPWMGDVYHLLRKHTLTNLNFDMSDNEVVEYLNSILVKRYIKDVFRDITYHLSITQLKIIPLPTKEELKKIKKEFQDDERLES